MPYFQHRHATYVHSMSGAMAESVQPVLAQIAARNVSDANGH